MLRSSKRRQKRDGLGGRFRAHSLAQRLSWAVANDGLSPRSLNNSVIQYRPWAQT